MKTVVEFAVETSVPLCEMKNEDVAVITHAATDELMGLVVARNHDRLMTVGQDGGWDWRGWHLEPAVNAVRVRILKTGDVIRVEE